MKTKKAKNGENPEMKFFFFLVSGLDFSSAYEKISKTTHVSVTSFPWVLGAG